MQIDSLNKQLINLAKISINDQLNGINSLNKEEFVEKFPEFNKIAATFVTLTIDGNLRGCIGSLEPRQSLYDDIVSNAHNAAFGDPRFSPLTNEEFKQTKIEISLLSSTSELEYDDFNDLKSKLIPNKHGVILKLHGHQATFLPQVWEQLPDFETFIYHLYLKAGLDINQENSKPQIFTYTVQKVEDYE
jgi:uncharacterized protein